EQLLNQQRRRREQKTPTGADQFLSDGTQAVRFPRAGRLTWANTSASLVFTTSNPGLGEQVIESVSRRRCDLLHLAYKLPMAHAPARFSTLGHRLFPVLPLAQERLVGAHPSHAAWPGARGSRQKAAADGGHHRQPECQNHRSGWRTGL